RYLLSVSLSSKGAMVQLLLSKATRTKTRHFAPFGVKLAEELGDKYNIEHTLHVLNCAIALMDFYK
ncbi:MAG: hypothetical protein ACKPKO_57385, partial [Candidatus Fonsibacter sp.]